MDGNTIINSRDMVPNPDGNYTVSINCGDDAINNISAPADIETIGYDRRVYGASEAVENRSWDPIEVNFLSSGRPLFEKATIRFTTWCGLTRRGCCGNSQNDEEAEEMSSECKDLLNGGQAAKWS